MDILLEIRRPASAAVCTDKTETGETFQPELLPKAPGANIFGFRHMETLSQAVD